MRMRWGRRPVFVSYIHDGTSPEAHLPAVLPHAMEERPDVVDGCRVNERAFIVPQADPEVVCEREHQTQRQKWGAHT